MRPQNHIIAFHSGCTVYAGDIFEQLSIVRENHQWLICRIPGHTVQVLACIGHEALWKFAESSQ